MKSIHMLLTVAFLAGFGAAVHAADPSPKAKELIDYFLPMTVAGQLSKDVWGAKDVGPRDPDNGLEDKSMAKWCYWDGQALKGIDGKYHLFACRWDEARGHGGWKESVAVHAVSDRVMGPYTDKGLCWPENQDGKAHNVVALIMPDGRYAITISSTRPPEVFASKSPDGPWESLGRITVEGRPDWFGYNVTPILRPDGRYQFVQSSGELFISDFITGPYKSCGPSAYWQAFKDVPRKEWDMEDPVIWHSGGLYQMVVNRWGQRKAYHLTSKDGMTEWVRRGVAYDPTTDFLRYTDGTVNHWNKIERPGVIIEDGHVTHFLFSVIDVRKELEKGNDRHGSKIIIVAFDGAALDRDLAEIIKLEQAPATHRSNRFE